jgi:hypothetical protein
VRSFVKSDGRAPYCGSLFALPEVAITVAPAPGQEIVTRLRTSYPGRATGRQSPTVNVTSASNVTKAWGGSGTTTGNGTAGGNVTSAWSRAAAALLSESLSARFVGLRQHVGSDDNATAAQLLPSNGTAATHAGGRALLAVVDSTASDEAAEAAHVLRALSLDGSLGAIPTDDDGSAESATEASQLPPASAPTSSLSPAPAIAAAGAASSVLPKSRAPAAAASASATVSVSGAPPSQTPSTSLSATASRSRTPTKSPPSATPSPSITPSRSVSPSQSAPGPRRVLDMELSSSIAGHFYSDNGLELLRRDRLFEYVVYCIAACAWRFTGCALCDVQGGSRRQFVLPL